MDLLALIRLYCVVNCWGSEGLWAGRAGEGHGTFILIVRLHNEAKYMDSAF